MIVGIDYETAGLQPLDYFCIDEITAEGHNVLLVKFKDGTYKSFNKIKIK